MQWIETEQALLDHYGTPGAAAMVKVTGVITPAYRAYLEMARFCALGTVGPEGTDVSPRGDEGPVVAIQNERTLLLPTGRGVSALIPCAT